MKTQRINSDPSQFTALFGNPVKVDVHWRAANRGNGVQYGPTNTLLTEPFYGDYPPNRAKALQESYKNALAEIYADFLISKVS